MSDDGVERFQRHYPFTYGAVEVQVFDVVRAADPWDEYREVWLWLLDCHYERFCTHFYRDPNGKTGYRCEVRGLVLVQELDTTRILEAVDDILGRGLIAQAFETTDEE